MSTSGIPTLHHLACVRGPSILQGLEDAQLLLRRAIEAVDESEKREKYVASLTRDNDGWYQMRDDLESAMRDEGDTPFVLKLRAIINGVTVEAS